MTAGLRQPNGTGENIFHRNHNYNMFISMDEDPVIPPGWRLERRTVEINWKKDIVTGVKLGV